LSKLQREVLLGRVIGGQTLQETSELLQVTVSQVRTALKNALTLIAAEFDLPSEGDLVIAFTEFLGADL
jgi:DNA-directed RNA polymerase specialized sigma24 family protein